MKLKMLVGIVYIIIRFDVDEDIVCWNINLGFGEIMMWFFYLKFVLDVKIYDVINVLRGYKNIW